MVGRFLKKRVSDFPPLQFTLEVEEKEPTEWEFTSSFRIGREKESDVEVGHSLVSRTHAEFVFADGQWWAHDLQSTNGLFHNGKKVQHTPLSVGDQLSLGKDGPVIRVTHVPDAPSTPAQSYPPMDANDLKAVYGKEDGERLAPMQATAPPAAAADPEGDGGPAAPPSPPEGFQPSQHPFTVRYIVYIAAAILFSVAGGLYGGYQFRQTTELRATAEELFYQVRGMDVLVAELQRDLAEQGAAPTQQDMRLVGQRERLRDQYDGYVINLGAYRSLEYEERLIYNVGRFLKESELTMPEAFKDEILDIIQNYWTTFKHEEYANAIRRADLLGYSQVLVEALQRNGLPPELAYLVLQETGFESDAVNEEAAPGTEQRGLWYLTPETAERFGLAIPVDGPGSDFDGTDERHDIEKATEAAVAYLSEIYTQQAEASGLLTLAAYHWSEHRLGESLATGAENAPSIDALFAGVPLDPQERNYWTYLERYPNRLSQETRDYVMKIFAAAVIGQDPRHFGFDFENPLEPYISVKAR